MRLFRVAGLSALAMLAISLMPSTMASAEVPNASAKTAVEFPGLAAAGQRARETGQPQPVVSTTASEFFAYLVSDSGVCLDLDHNTGPKILAYHCDWESNQYWKLTPSPGTAIYEIKPYHYQNDCVDVLGNVGPQLIKHPCKLSDNQRWIAWTDGDGYVYFSPLSNTSQCLDAEAGTFLALASACQGGANQRWRPVT